MVLAQVILKPIPKQAPVAPDGFAPQWIGGHDPNNNNGWIKEDNEEEEEAKEEDVEEMEAEEDEKMEIEGNEEENEAEITHPYKEADPLNRPPPSPETAKQEFMNAPVGQSTVAFTTYSAVFGTFSVGEGSSATVFNPTLSKVYPLGPMINDLGAIYAMVKTLTKQMWDGFRVETLDSARRDQIQEMKKLMEELNERFQQIQERDLRAKNEMLRIKLRVVEEKGKYKHMEAEYYKNHFARMSGYYDVLRGWEYIVRNQDNAVHVDASSNRGGEGVNTSTVVKDVGEEKGDKGDDVAAAKDSRPLESRRSPPEEEGDLKEELEEEEEPKEDNAVHVDASSDRGGEGVNTSTVVKDAGEEKGDKGDDVAAAKDSRPLESRGSPRDQQTMPPTRRSQTNPQPPLTQEAINQLVREGIETAIRAERERVREEATEAVGPAGDPAAAPVA
nr:hypothetical protein [Tanacetum cinerariifolium]